jgi:uncharacterized protein (TIGR02678 family)
VSASGAHLADVLARGEEEDRRRALRALLVAPLLTRAHPDFALVRRHAQALREWFARETGWDLIVEDDFARLRKQAADHADATRGARLRAPAGSPPFTRRRYALACLALAELERGETQITLGRLGEALVAAAAQPELAERGFSFRLEERDERRDLVAVVRLLLELGVLVRVAGEEESFVRAAQRDVLYDVNRRLLAVLLVTARGASLVARELAPQASVVERMHAIGERFVADLPDARNTALRQRLTARLLDNPVLYHDTLTPEEMAYLASQRPHIVRRIQDATGLVAEVRVEGIAMVDGVGDLCDEHLPGEGTESHATLLLAGHLAAAREPVAHAELEQCMRGWIAQYGRYWRKSAREPHAEQELCRGAIERLCALALARVEGPMVRPLPAIARHALGEPEVLVLSGDPA